MSTEIEGKFTIDGVELYTKTFTPTTPIKARLVFIHGFSDHVNRYYEFFPTLAARGIQTFAFDQRGWGRSASSKGERGNTGPTTKVIADMVAFINDKLSSSPSPPLFLMGHSMGGGQVATLISDPAHASLLSQIRGVLFDAPFLGFTPGEEPSVLKVFFGRLASNLFPRMQLAHELTVEHTSRDPTVVQSVRDDELCHNTGTLEGLSGLLDRTDVLASGKSSVCPEVRSLVVMHGTDDRLADPAAAKTWLEKQKEVVGDASFVSYEGAYHQLHADLCRDEFYKDVGDWILERAEAGEAGQAKPESKL